MGVAFSFGQRHLDDIVTEINSFQEIGIIGAGTMGQGIGLDLLDKTNYRITFVDINQEAFLISKAAYDIWVIKHSASEVSVYSPLCPHLNCRVTLNNDQFACPCHGSIFSFEGKVLGGPSPRPLDTLPYKVEGGELYVQWKLYKAGIPEKAEA